MFSLNYREMWSGAAGWLADELDQIVAAAQAKWFTQHTGTGAHGDVTASRVASDVWSISAPFVYSVPEVTNTSSTSPGTTLMVPRRTSSIVLRAPFPAGATYWYGIHSLNIAGAVPGDIVTVVRNISGGPLLLSSVGSDSPGGSIPPYYPLGHRIFLNGASASTQTSDSVTYFEGLAVGVKGVTLLRVDAFDYDVVNSGLRYPAWVQIG